MTAVFVCIPLRQPSQWATTTLIHVSNIDSINAHLEMHISQLGYTSSSLSLSPHSTVPVSCPCCTLVTALRLKVSGLGIPEYSPSI